MTGLPLMPDRAGADAAVIAKAAEVRRLLDAQRLAAEREEDAAERAMIASERGVSELATLKATTLLGLIAKASTFVEDDFAERDLSLCGEQLDLALSVMRDLVAMGMGTAAGHEDPIVSLRREHIAWLALCNAASLTDEQADDAYDQGRAIEKRIAEGHVTACSIPGAIASLEWVL